MFYQRNFSDWKKIYENLAFLIYKKTKSIKIWLEQIGNPVVCLIHNMFHSFAWKQVKWNIRWTVKWTEQPQNKFPVGFWYFANNKIFVYLASRPQRPGMMSFFSVFCLYFLVFLFYLFCIVCWRLASSWEYRLDNLRVFSVSQLQPWKRFQVFTDSVCFLLFRTRFLQ